MSRGRETPDQSAELLFGMSSVREWLEKARRERKRFLESNDPVDRIDHAINFAITASHLEDWAYHLHVLGNSEEWPEEQSSGKFDAWVRGSCLAMELLADLNNAAKHRVLNRRGSPAVEIREGGITYRIEYFAIYDAFVKKIAEFSEIIDVEEVRRDGELIAYDIHATAHMFRTEQGVRLFIDVANEAIRFWEGFVDAHTDE